MTDRDRPVILLVTGSRALTATPAARAWACTLVQRAVDELTPRDLIVTGDARGPDAMATDSAARRRVRVAQGLRGGAVLG